MRQCFICIGICICFWAGTAAAQSGKNLRQKLVVALNNASLTDSLHNALTAVKNRSAQQNAYLAAVEALKAKQVWSPFSKLRYVDKAEQHLDDAVKQDAHSIEVRFIRFSIEHHVPSFLGYGKHLDADRKEIIRLLNSTRAGLTDKELEVTITRFLLDSGRCTSAETADLHKKLAYLN